MAGGRDYGLADIGRDVATARPDHPAVLRGEAVLTYDELDRRANQVANGLLAAGAGRGDRVGVLTRTGPEFCAIPRNAAGEILRRELRAPLWAGADRHVA